jgi:hypothetical protein
LEDVAAACLIAAAWLCPIGQAGSAERFFTVVFYGLRIFGCKTAQLCVARCESYCAEIRGICNKAQSSEIMRKKLFLELQISSSTTFRDFRCGLREAVDGPLIRRRRLR